MEGYSGYLTNRTLPGQIAQATNGAVGKLIFCLFCTTRSACSHVFTITVFLEHRCFGESNPYPDLKESTLKYLSVDQAIEGASAT
jgi:hypothetical protein